MCLNPISLPIKVAGRVVDYNVVPCGKCPECVDRRQKDMMQVFLNVARRSENIVFATFTYDDEHLPKMYNLWDYESGSCVKQSFERSDLEPDEFQDILEVPSLKREDWRLWLKRARVKWFRDHGENLCFVYATIGEYGKLHQRPHYHTMFFDLTFAQAQELCSSWHFGFTYCEQVNKSQSLTGVCRYMAKYLYKGLFESDDVLNGLSQKPRVLASKNLIQVDDQFRSWLIGEDLGFSLDTRFIRSDDAERLLARRKLLIDDFNYNLGKHYLDKIFKRVEYDEEGKRKLVNTPLQDALSRFIRKRADSVRDSQLRQAQSFADPEEGSAYIIQVAKVDELSREARAERCCSSLQEYYSRSKL